MSEHPHHAVERLSAEHVEYLDEVVGALSNREFYGSANVEWEDFDALITLARTHASTAARADRDQIAVLVHRGKALGWTDLQTADAIAAQQTATAVSRETLAFTIWNTTTKLERTDADAVAEAVLSLLLGGEGLARAEAGR